MNLHRYLEKKTEITKRSFSHAPREMCPRCFRAQKSCFCESIKPFSTNAHFVILMHPKEARKGRNGTGRLAELCLENARIEVGIDFTQNPVVNTLLNNPGLYPLLLYPGVHSINISEKGFPPFLREEKKLLFFIMDGTWSLAKKIITRSKNLHSLPKIAFTPENPSRFIIKRQPTACCLSTIEALHTLLKLLERTGLETLKGRHRILIQACDSLVNYQLACIKNNRVQGFRRSPFEVPHNILPTVK
jgi:DTW domain-containing protein YfiP